MAEEKKSALNTHVIFQITTEPNVIVTRIEVPYSKQWEIATGQNMLKSGE
jgi:hypothetical protein